MPGLTVHYAGFVNEDTSASLTTQPTVTTTATVASNVGSYPITAGGAADANYTISYVGGTLTVTPSPITLNSPNAGATWKVGTSQTVSWTISGDTSKISYLSVLLSTNNGSSYTAISPNLSGSAQSFSYTPNSNQATTSAVILVRAFDSNGDALAGATSSGPFTIQLPPAAPILIGPGSSTSPGLTVAALPRSSSGSKCPAPQATC